MDGSGQVVPRPHPVEAGLAGDDRGVADLLPSGAKGVKEHVDSHAATLFPAFLGGARWRWAIWANAKPPSRPAAPRMCGRACRCRRRCSAGAGGVGGWANGAAVTARRRRPAYVRPGDAAAADALASAAGGCGVVGHAYAAACGAGSRTPRNGRGPEAVRPARQAGPAAQTTTRPPRVTMNPGHWRSTGRGPLPEITKTVTRPVGAALPSEGSRVGGEGRAGCGRAAGRARASRAARLGLEPGRPADRDPDQRLHRRAGDGNRTRMTSLEGWDSTIELHPRAGA